VRRPAASAGFTLVEVLVAVLILALILSTVYELLLNSARHADSLKESIEGPKLENALLDEIVRDLRFAYYRPGQFPADAGFWGRSRQVNGRDADRIDFLTCRASKKAELEDASRQQVSAPLIEVGYACRPNDDNGDWFELWRRERYFVDDDPTDGGRYDLLHGKMRRFDIRYYLPPEERPDSDRGLEEWDSKTQHKLPYAMEITVQFDVREPIQRDQPQVMVKRIVMMTQARSVAPDAAMSSMDSGMSSMR
jgi:prepilin-type N-terminal cleavage/methylation domain-containing protein